MSLNWEKITEEELRKLFQQNKPDSYIADLYGVSIGKVRYKRRKYGINFKNAFFEELKNPASDKFQMLNQQVKEQLFIKENIDLFAKAITQFAFRNGPIEDMHTNGQLSQNDMKILNKYMVNRLAGLLEKCFDGQWMQIQALFDYYNRYYGTNWDKAEPDVSEFDLYWTQFMSNLNATSGAQKDEGEE